MKGCHGAMGEEGHIQLWRIGRWVVFDREEQEA